MAMKVILVFLLQWKR